MTAGRAHTHRMCMCRDVTDDVGMSAERVREPFPPAGCRRSELAGAALSSPFAACWPACMPVTPDAGEAVAVRGSDSHALRGWDTRAAVGDETALAGKVGCTLIWCVLTQNCTH